MADDRTFEDAMHTSLPGHYLQMLVLLSVLVLTLRKRSAAPSRWRKNQRNLLTVSAILAKRVPN